MREYYANKRQNYLEMLGGECVECSSKENLEFDHVDRSNKNFAIGKLMSYSKEIILNELKLCQILCKNCHDLKSLYEKAIGSKNGNSKLTELDVLQIKKNLKEGVSNKELAIKYNVSDVAISKIKNNKNWTHISEG